MTREEQLERVFELLRGMVVAPLPDHGDDFTELTLLLEALNGQEN